MSEKQNSSIILEVHQMSFFLNKNKNHCKINLNKILNISMGSEKFLKQEMLISLLKQ